MEQYRQRKPNQVREVLLPPTGFAGDPDKVPKTAPYKKYVTQWG